MGLPQLAIVPVTQHDVEIAWATFRALAIAEADDPELANDLAHQNARALAMERFQRLFNEWDSQ